MIQVRFPKPDFNIKKERERQYIFDNIRKAWLLLTPEEWVRQNFVAYLISELNYPSALIALEKEILLNELKKRFDILVYDKVHQPWMMVECKAPGVKLDDGVLQQVLRYNITVPVKYLIITNGEATEGWEKEGGRLRMLEEMPDAC
ncbi:MAG TPA: type I restriction enzyme HsdR N-terminal domain-containing protein [Flavisolibacter sp.]|nr:type I restriction enzyme HsdR N-terminal domain-containing protein [Flavisolibacter sp.]